LLLGFPDNGWRETYPGGRKPLLGKINRAGSIPTAHIKSISGFPHINSQLDNLALRAAGTSYSSTTTGAILFDTNSFKVDVINRKVEIGSLMSTGGVSYYKANINGSFLFLGTDSTSESPIFKIVPPCISNTHTDYTTTTLFIVYDAMSG
jgi:hypothetical protein